MARSNLPVTGVIDSTFWDVFDLRYGVMNACLDVREDVARLVGFGHFFLRRAVEAQVLSLRVVTKECLRW